MRLIPSIILAMCMCSFPAFAATPKWVQLGSNEQLTLSLDANSVRPLSDPGWMQVWARVDYKDEQKTPGGAVFDRIERISVYNCPMSTRRAVLSVYFRKGRVIDASRSGETDVIPINQNDLGKAALSIVCKSHQ